MQFKFCTSHVHAYVFSFLFYSCFLVVIVVLSFSLSLSLSLIDRTWHPKCINPLWAKILFKVPILLLLIPFPFLTFGSMMRRPKRTSWRNFRNMAFIQSAMLFRRTSLTLLSLPSFGLGAGNLYFIVPKGVPSCLYRSFTPIYTVSIPLYLDLPRNF